MPQNASTRQGSHVNAPRNGNRSASVSLRTRAGIVRGSGCGFFNLGEVPIIRAGLSGRTAFDGCRFRDSMANSTSESETTGRIAGVDFGIVRIGVAITDRSQKIASPLDNYQRRGKDLDAQYFQLLAQREEVGLFVVGLPVHLSGNESQKSQEARQFGEWLSDTTGVPVVFFDERFTTHMADELLSAADLTKKKRQARRDMLAAQILLSAYLDSGSAGRSDTLGLDDD